MAGSRKWFIYTSDKGVLFAVNRDESNTNVVNGGTGTYTGNPKLDPLPRGIKPRYVEYEDNFGNRKIKCTILSPKTYSDILNDSIPVIVDPIDGTSQMAMGLITPEIPRRQPKGVNTGLTDPGVAV